MTRLSTVQLFEFPLLKFLGKVKLIISKNSFLFFEEKKYLSIPSPDFLPLLNFFLLRQLVGLWLGKKYFYKIVKILVTVLSKTMFIIPIIYKKHHYFKSI